MMNISVTSQVNIMELPEHVVKKAKEIVSSKAVMPAIVDERIGFYVSKENDETIHSFGGFIGEDGISYKIGVKK